jgi:hypothetical protein
MTSILNFDNVSELLFIDIRGYSWLNLADHFWEVIMGLY